VTPSQQAKAAGLKSLAQAQEMTGQSRQTLTNWHRHKPDLFAIVLAGCTSNGRNEMTALVVPEVGGQWTHKKTGSTYGVLHVSNLHATRDGWPITVVYEDDEGRVWSRPLTEWGCRYERVRT
jgi:hypothetical protein